MTFSTASCADAYESEVASRFDELVSRFKLDVSPDDPRLDALHRWLGPVMGRLVLDLGCGKGRFAACLSESGARVIGFDLSHGMLQAARQKRLSVARASARRLPLADACSDAVVLVEVIEHVAPSDLSSLLREVHRVLRPGGKVLIIDKNAASLDPVRPWLPAVVVKRIDEYRGRWMYSAGSPVRERWFWPGQIPFSLRRAGFVRCRSESLRSQSEARHRIFHWVPMARRFVLWSAFRPEGGDDGR